jgi:hypothetical protein
MKNGSSREEQVASSAHAWTAASRGTDMAARVVAERQFADSVERWVAELLTTDDRWLQQGRWFDGLVFVECREENGCFHLGGHIWGIDQRQYAFQAELQLLMEGLTAFDVRVAQGKAPSRRSAEPEWAFHFVRTP